MASHRRIEPLHLVMLALWALFAVSPLIVHGCSCGHDFDFHLESWFDAARQLRAGELHPHWAFSPAWNAGEPRFVFYPPLSWYIGAATGLLLTHIPGVGEPAAWNAVPIAFTWLALTFSGLAMYRLARDYALPGAALFAAAIYLSNPYMLFTAYERTAYGELLAAAWMPLLLHGLLRPRITIPRIAVPLALLWITNAPAAVIGSYMLAFVGLIRCAAAWEVEKTPQESRLIALIRAGRLAPAVLRVAGPLNLGLPLVSGAALGLLLAAFYIVPAAYEQRYVQIHMAEIPGMQIADNFLFHHTTGPDAALHDQVLHTASVIAVLLLVSALSLLVANHLLCRRPAPVGVPAAGLRKFPTALLSMLAGVLGFLLTRLSGPFWRHAPEAAFLQFPWRAVSVIAVIAGLGISSVLTRAKLPARTQSIAGVLACSALVLCCYHIFRQGCDPEDTTRARFAAFTVEDGFEPTDEYTPVGADNDTLAQADPPYWLASRADAVAPQTAVRGPAPLHLTLRLPRAEDLILNLRSYPTWTVLLDGAPDLQRLQRPDGLIAIPLPAGASTVNIRYTRLPDQKVGDLLTLLGVGLLAGSLLPLRWRVSDAAQDVGT